jgi:hypothetical protein
MRHPPRSALLLAGAVGFAEGQKLDPGRPGSLGTACDIDTAPAARSHAPGVMASGARP